VLYVIGVLYLANKKLIFRLLGVVLGVVFTSAGIWFLINPILGGITEILSQISQVLIGLLFLFHGVTGHSSLYKFIYRHKE